MSLIEKLLETESQECRDLAKKNKDFDLFESDSKKLEAKAWLLFYYMQPLRISSDPQLISLKSGKYEIDVFAEFEDVLVTVECKSGESHDVNSNIDKVKANKGDIQNYLRGEFGTEKPCVFIVIYSDKIVPIVSFKKAKRSNVEIWNRYLLNEYFSIASTLKPFSQKIILSDLLAQKKLQWGRGKKKFNCLVTKGSYKGNDCYSFQMSPEILLKIAYVHRRNFFNALDVEEITYQRMIDLNKIKSIQKFLNKKGNSFPTPILINFEKDLEFNPISPRSTEKRTESITPGWLTIPEEYGFAWIIDGQHRLFGYSGLGELAKQHTLNVVAFSNLDPSEQANLFVEINQNQKSIAPDYLWDLYTDIYPEEDDKYKMSKIVKDLNSKSEFFKDRVYIPGLSNREKKHYSLQINNIGVSIKSKASLVYKKLLDSNSRAYYELIDNYFSSLIDTVEAKEDWCKGDNGFLSSNNGVGVMMYVLNNFYQYILNSKCDTKHLSISHRTELLNEFTEAISRSLNKIGFDNLNKLKKEKSSEGGRKSIANDVIIKAGEDNRKFKELANQAFLQNVSEDLNNEFKETLCYNIREQKYDNSLFEETILGTLCAYINAGVDGNIYVGIGDDKQYIGLDRELSERFHGVVDEMFQYIEDGIKNKLITKDFSTIDIDINVFQERNLILQIHVPKSDNGTAIVKVGSKPMSWIKRISMKTRLDDLQDSDLQSELGQKRYHNYHQLRSEFFRNIIQTT